MKWGEFKSAVKARLIEYANIDGADDIDEHIKDCIEDLSSDVDEYKIDATSTYSASQLSEAGQASMGSLPPLARVRSWYFVDASGVAEEDQQPRQRLKVVGWGKRHEMQDGTYPTCIPVVCVSPDGKDFYVWPKLDENTLLLCNYQTLKLDWDDEDEVPYARSAIRAAYHWCMADRKLHVDEDIQGFQVHMTSYKYEKLKCVRQPRG